MTALLILAAYLLGAVPTGYLVGRAFKGIDIRQVGSGNPGATNVFRTVGKTAGLLTLFIDVLKGFAPVWVALQTKGGSAVPVACGLAAVAGHTWSVFLGFKGGKGVATSAGVFGALLPLATLMALGAFILGFGLSRHVSVGSLSSAMVLPPAAFWQRGSSLEAYLASAVGVLVVVRHIPNVQRLLRGQEFSPVSATARKKPDVAGSASADPQ
jgi:acyl phosphate:glycerol-3-phosphate acyltransferase